jgi:hypothetical protein
MSTANVVLRSGETAGRICARADVSEDAQVLLADGRGAREFVLALIEGELFGDAVGFLAHVLPRREAVWWAWTCAGEAAGAKPAPAVAASLDATKQWIIQPTDPNRRAAMAAAEATEFAVPAGLAGFAAFLCGDSLTPADAPAGTPAVAPDPWVAAKAIAGCVCMAAAEAADQTNERFRAFLDKGLEMADKRQVWAPDPAGPTKKA